MRQNLGHAGDIRLAAVPFSMIDYANSFSKYAFSMIDYIKLFSENGLIMS